MEKEEYYKALGAYTHHLNEALKKGEEFRRVAFEIAHIVRSVTSANHPFSEHSMPPAVDSAKLSSLTKELIRLNEEIQSHTQKANLYAKEAKKDELQRKDY